MLSFADTLNRLMAEHGESGYRLAKELNVAQQSVANWRHGWRIPHPKTREKIAAHYKITMGELMGSE